VKKFLLGLIQSGNLAVIIAQLSEVFPANKWLLVIQAILAAVMPSAFGVGHKLFFGNDQDPKTK
jgi:hypothetical protein